MFNQALQAIVDSVSSARDNISVDEFTEFLSNDPNNVYENKPVMDIISAVFEPDADREVLDFLCEADNDTLIRLAVNSPDELRPYIRGAVDYVIENGY